jgi:hypothetical protein
MPNETTPKEQKVPYSRHIFLFPFKWDITNGKPAQSIPLEERIDMGKMQEIMSNCEKHWTCEDFDIKTNYNQASYFYQFVHPALFHVKETDFTTVLNYTYSPKEGKFIIKIENRPSEYTLHIEAIKLSFYRTGVGVLSFHLSNHEHGETADILYINEYGRRIYPQFLENDGVKNTKKAFLADEVTLELGEDEKTIIKETFKNFDSDKTPPQNFLPEHILGLLGSSFYTDNTANTATVLISPIVDDRMFVVSCYLNDVVSNSLKKRKHGFKKGKHGSDEYNYLTNDFWYKYLFIDKDKPSCRNEALKKQLLERHSYSRWVEDNQLFGICRYTFVCLTNKEHDWLYGQMSGNYFLATQLVLMQRASILRFSDEITHISHLEKNKDLSKRIGELHKHYIQFINKLYFREVTAQEQGIELYEMLQTNAKIDRDISTLDQELQELHDYAVLIEEQARNDRLELLTIIGALFLAPSFLTGFFGMNLFGEGLSIKNEPIYCFVVVFFTLLALAVLLYYLSKNVRAKKGNKWWPLTIGFALLAAMLVAMLLPCWFGKPKQAEQNTSCPKENKTELKDTNNTQPPPKLEQ